MTDTAANRLNDAPTPAPIISAPPADRDQRIRLGDAWRAMKQLLADPDDTEKVFVIIQALSGKSGERQFQRFAASAVGRQVLTERRDLIATLSDREALRSMPAGSFGRAYADFMDQEQISADGLVDASEGPRPEGLFQDENRDRFGRRMRDSHDLWHVLTGYSRDLVGEASLLAFTFAQTRNPGIGFIVLMAYLRSKGEIGFGRQMIREGYRRGRRAGWLPAADWEALLPQPLASVRRTLGVGDPPEYTQLRSEAGEAALAAQ